MGSVLGGAKDVLFGKKQAEFVAQSPEELELNQLALEQARESGGVRTLGFERLKEEAGEEPGAFQRAQIEREIGAGRKATEDTRRRLQEVTAQRGLGRSSAALGAEVSLGQRQAMREATKRASLTERIRKEKQGLTSRLISAGGPQQQFMRRQSTGRSGREGGLSGAIGAGIGAAFGGPAGAQIGAGIGQSLG